MRSNKASALMQAPPDQHTWKWVLDSLRSSRAADHPCQMNIVDTILLDQGRPAAWLFTTRSGIIKRKTGSRLTFPQIQKALVRTAMNYNRNASGPQLAAVVHGQDSIGDNLVFVDAGGLEQYCNKALPTSAYAMQAFIEPRGDWSNSVEQGRIANFRTVMSLDRTGRHSTQCYRLGAPTGFQDNKAQGVAFVTAQVRSMDTAVNNPLHEQTMALVRTLEGVRKCRVRKMISDFVVDTNGIPWFINTIEVHTVDGKSKQRALERAASKQQEERFVSISSSGQVGSSSHHKHNGGGSSQKKKTLSANERAMSPNTLKAYQRLAARKERTQDALINQARLVMAKPVQPRGNQSIAHASSNNSFTKGAARTALGTSQSAGCPGDFCNYSVALDDQGARGGGGDGSGGAGDGLNNHEKSGVIARLRESALNEGLMSTHHNDKKSINVSKYHKESKIKVQQTLKQQHANVNSYRVPYYWVPRARAERVLVTLMLRRYSSGETGDYLSTLDNTTEMSDVLGANYPSHFYKDVDVCENCMKIYKLIDEARDSATEKLERKLQGKSNNGKARELVWDEKPPPINERWADASMSTRGADFSQSIEQREINVRQEGMARAEAAIACLTKSDISELRSFNNPPQAVVMVTRAVMLLLTGDPNVEWKKAKKIMANGDRFFGMLSRAMRGIGNEKELPRNRFLTLQKFTDHPNFHPDCVEPISSSAARFCAWVLGMVQAHGWATGTAHPRIDPLRPYSAPGEEQQQDGNLSMASLPPVHESASLLDSLTFAEKLIQERKERASTQKWNQSNVLNSVHEHSSKYQDEEDMYKTNKTHLSGSSTLSAGQQQSHQQSQQQSKEIKWGSTRDLSPPRAQSPERGRRDGEVLMAFGRHTSQGLDVEEGESSLMMSEQVGGSKMEEISKRGRGLIRKGLEGNQHGKGQQGKSKKPKLTRKQKRARAKIQARQMARLAGGDEGMKPAAGGDGDPSSSKTDEGEMFVCADGITAVPYEVMGTQELDGKNTNFIVIHDFFDTSEATGILFQRLVKRFVGCQVMVFNQPGQADSRWKPTANAAEAAMMAKHGTASQNREPVLNNITCADKLHELLQHLEETGEFVTSAQPFYVMGIGNGANIATAFSLRYGDTRDYGNTLRSLVLMNGFAHVDNQLAAVLHSSINVFSCFPETRPDLPISYFTRFLFSDSYLQKIDPNLVLNIYTAVANNITLGGRIAICKGALRHVDLRPRLPEIQVPIIIVQSTENVLVAPTNVDPFLEGRSVMHLWSHQHNGEGMNPRAHKQLQDTLMGASGRNAFVMWLNAGHEARQECKPAILDLLTRLASPESAIPEEIAEKQRKNMKMKDSVKIKGKKRKGKKKKTKKKKKNNDASMSIDQEGKYEGKYDQMAHTFSAGGQGEHLGEDDGNTLDEEDLMAQSVPADMKPLEKEVEKSEEKYMEFQKESPVPLDQHPSVLEARRQARLLETQNEFEMAMKSHQKKNKRPGTTSNVAGTRDFTSSSSSSKYEEKTYSSKEKGGVDIGVSSQPATGLGLRTLDQEKKELEAKLLEYRAKRQVKDEEDENELAAMIYNMKQEQVNRSQKWKEDDQSRLNKLENDLKIRKQKRNVEDIQRRNELENLNTEIKYQTEQKANVMLDEHKQSKIDAQVESAMSHVTEEDPEILAAKMVEEAEKARKQFQVKQMLAKSEAAKGTTLGGMFDDMEGQDKEMRRLGILKMEDFEKVKEELVLAEVRKKEMLDQMARGVVLEREQAACLVIQSAARGMFGRTHARLTRMRLEQEALEEISALKMQAVVRGHLGRQRVQAHRFQLYRERLERQAAGRIQRVYRGMLGRNIARDKRENRAAGECQRVYRGHLGRLRAEVERERLERIALEHRSATGIQATFRMFAGRMEYIDRRVREVASVQVQRIWRGVRGRRRFDKKRLWESTAPGPERLKLGLTLIDETKDAFTTQQEEINALHRAQERAETRVSEIHEGLKESEEELKVLERELQDIDTLDRELHELTHEKSMLESKVNDAEDKHAAMQAAVSENDLGGAADGTGGTGGRNKLDAIARRKQAKKLKAEQRERAAEAYALEMAIHLKRAERERKKKELEAEFAGVFAEVEKKKNELQRLEARISDMEATRKRKDREFSRLQRNLMELLEEQKVELDTLREKGIELETATATSAAAAAATAHAAKENEQRSKAMFESTEELMKFQFMSMSLSYFSSLNMLKTMRDINSDTTSAAIASSASTAAAAAAAAAAANIPELKHLKMGTSDVLDASTKKKKQRMIEEKLKAEEAKKMLQEPFPEDIAVWTVEDVCRWLDTISLSQYKRAFREGSVDGSFLTELRSEDLRDVLGMEHELHRKKVLVMINKMKPLDQQETQQRDIVLREESSDQQRDVESKKEIMPTLDQVFSMCRNGRFKRLSEALDLGFPVDTADQYGNTLLLLASQQTNQRIVEMLLDRRANINHQNNLGNTPLHYAMAYDTDGALGEYLIGRGSDDMLENKMGLSPYDGLE